MQQELSLLTIIQAEILTPSEADKLFTKRIIRAGELMGIEILDHIIVTDEDYCSLRAEGLWQ